MESRNNLRDHSHRNKMEVIEVKWKKIYFVFSGIRDSVLMEMIVNLNTKKFQNVTSRNFVEITNAPSIITTSQRTLF